MVKKVIKKYKCHKCKTKLFKAEVKATYMVKKKRVFLCVKCRNIINYYLGVSDEKTSVINYVDEARVKLYFGGIKNGKGNGKNISVQRVKSRSKKKSYRVVKRKA